MGMLDLGTLRIGIAVDNKDAKQELRNFANELKNGKASWASFKTVAIASSVAAASAAVAFATKATKEFLDVSDHIDKMSQKLGISAEAYQEWDYVMGHAGMDIDSFNKAMRTMRTNLNEGSEAFDKLGIATKNADGSLRSDEEVMKDAILTLADMEDTTERNRLAQELWGNSYTEMLPLLNEGSEAIEEQIQSAHDLGLVIDGEAVSAGAHLGDTLADIKSAFGTIGTQLAITILPLIQQVADFILEHMPEITAVLNGVVSVVVGIVQIVGYMGSSIIQIIGMILSLLGNAFMSVVGYVKQLGDNFHQNIEDTKKGISDLVETIRGIATDLWNAGKNAIDNFLGGIKNAWESVVGWVEEKVQWVKDKFSGIGNIINGATQGSHRTGLREVPYDGYIAELHKGEMVLTAAEANAYQKQASGTQTVSNITVNNYSPKALTEAETARQFRKTQRRLELGFGG